MSGVISAYTRTLGEVLREHRKAKGWTRKQLQPRLPDSSISLQTLATYELGTRHCSVERLDELARTLGTQANVILAEVDRRMYGTEGELAVNLAALAASTRDDLAPAAQWAAIHVAELAGIAQPVIALSVDALGMLADICRLDIGELFRLLRAFATA